MKLFNSITGKKVEFVPIVANEIKMYACGPTVYNYFHVGNARTFMVFDAMRKYFEYRGYNVTFVQNFTDVDDKIINKAKEEKTTTEVVSEKYIKEYFFDADLLGINRADSHPKVTENMQEIIEFISLLIDKGYAYAVEGDVYFDVSKYEEYGKLSKQNLDELRAGARVETKEIKRGPLDFALWKTAKEGEPRWEAKWGKGRPGWHIECSAMIKKTFGGTIDIHGGGSDLKFPHHENEIAQSEALTGKPLANFWIHVGFLNIDNKKMSKSLDNFFTVREIQEEFDLEVIRFFLLSAHYRSPLNFGRELVESSQRGLERLYNAKNNLAYLIKHAEDIPFTKNENKWTSELVLFREKFILEMDDDFNTANGIAVIFDLVKHINSNITGQTSTRALKLAHAVLVELCGVLGLLLEKEEESLEEEIEKLIKTRQQARKDKDFEKADKIRGRLLDKGIFLEDTPSGVKWSRK
ncbi:MAG: cysteine--tRNA ligase [Clostridiales bacterium]|nr:cysteine--tRNA ligase [Clostridiales bacterium]